MKRLFGTWAERPNGERGMILIAASSVDDALKLQYGKAENDDLVLLLPLAELPVPFYVAPDEVVFAKIGELDDIVHTVANNGCFCPPQMTW